MKLPTTIQADLSRLFERGTLASLADSQLLAIVVDPRDPADSADAFSLLVARHGPRVWGTCRLLLPHLPDAEDAFQATFLVLARRAAGLRITDSLAPWLLGVVRKVASRIHHRRARAFGLHLQDELLLDLSRPPSNLSELAESSAHLHAEVARLPAIYREAITLHYFDGLPLDQAALRINRPLGTIKNRLHRARDLLRRRLSRRGVSLAVPLTLQRALLDVVRLSLSSPSLGPTQIALVSSSVALLVKEVTISMIRVPALATVTLALGVTTAGALALQSTRDRDLAPTSPSSPAYAAQVPARSHQAPPAPSIPRENAKIILPEYIVEPPDLLRVEVLEALPGRPITGEHLVRPDGKISLGFYGYLQVAGLTTDEIKEKVILNLRKHMNDETLGLIRIESKPDSHEEIAISPSNSDRVFVEVVAYNSKCYYVAGEVAAPGRLTFTGSETVLDAINYAGGLLPGADPHRITLVRPPGSPGNQRDIPLTLTIDYDSIVHMGDPSFNYQLFPGDRLIVPRLAAKAESGASGAGLAVPARIERIEELLSRLSIELEALRSELKPSESENE